MKDTYDMITASEAAEILGISKQQVLYHARKGHLQRLPHVKAVAMFDRGEVEAFKAALEGLYPRMVAKIFGVSEPTVVRWVQSGQLEGARVGRRWRCTPQGVRVVAEARGVIIPEGVLGDEAASV